MGATSFGIAGLGYSVVFLIVLVSGQAHGLELLTESVVCPGLEPGPLSGYTECTVACQQATCTALATFFNSTYNSTNHAIKPWRNRQGWDNVLTQTCDDILTTTTGDGLPAYCGWYGVTCCTNASAPTSMFINSGPCTTSKSVTEISLQINGLNGSITAEGFEQSIEQLHACGMTRIVLSGNALSGSLTDFWGRLTNLTYLNLGKNLVEGTIPDAIRGLSKLAVLDLERNLLHGTLPNWLSELQSLQLLSLSAQAGHNENGKQGLIGTLPTAVSDLQHLSILSIGSNALTGSLPAGFCHSSFWVMDIRDNAIHGGLEQLLECGNLWVLDISKNKFSGLLPGIPPGVWSGMSTIDASSNDIEGPIPPSFYQLPSMTFLNMAQNRLNGTISSAIGRMPNLMSIKLRNNQLTGPLDESIWYLPRLSLVDLADNQLTGTLSSAIGMSYYTATILLDNNRLHGRIPSELGYLNTLVNIDLDHNTLSCSRADPNSSYGQPCEQGQELPCFLQLSHVVVPKADASNMECPLVERKAYAAAVQDCSGHGPTQLGDQASNLAEVDVTVQHWDLDPAYYQYKGCSCLGGYHASWSFNNTVLTCVQDYPSSLPIWVRPITIGLSVTGFLLLSSIALVVWFRVTVQLRRRLHRENELMKNRLKGIPHGGPASIVVTDVEGYSELMQQNPIATTRAMGVQNAILRKAVAAHAGHVVEQEGDSWSVAFHRPVDAVAFCLQVQQALQRSHWPAELYGSAAPKLGFERYTSTASVINELGPATGDTEPKPLRRSASHSKAMADSAAGQIQSTGPQDGIITLAGAAAAVTELSNEASHSSSLMAGLMHRFTGQGHIDRKLSKDSIPQRGTSITQAQAAGHVITGAGKILHSSAAGTLTPSAASLTQYNSRAASVTQQNTREFSTTQQNTKAASKQQRKAQRRASQESATSSDRGSSYTQATSQRERTGSIIWVSHGAKGAKGNTGAVRGLKIRMGVVSGWVPEDSEITRSALFMLAKGVSEMANGGQILMNCSTAEAVRELLTELGGVDHKGYNDKLLLRAHKEEIRNKARTACRWLSSCFRTAIKIATHDRDAVLLNMGQFWVPSLTSTLQAVAAANPVDRRRKNLQSLIPMGTKNRRSFDIFRDAAPGALHTAPKPLLQLHGSTAAVAAAATAAINDAAALEPSCMGLQLFSIIARPLHVRCKVWKGNLKLPQSAQQIAKGYFDAPGTVVAHLSPAAAFLDVERPLLPPVTMVFAAVEAGKVLVRKRERVAAIIHNVISRTMQALLLALPDGYLCREQEAVLKYMVAFKDPARAAGWCIMMQDVMQHIPWSAEVVEGLASLAARPSASSSGGRATSSTAGLIGRPRLKMGLAEGVPDEIAPDHLGRADYFGNSVNLAARIMSTAAHAGQVVMSLETAQGIFSSWSYEAEVGMYGPKAGQPQHNQQPGEWNFIMSSLAGGTAEASDPPLPTAAPAAIVATVSVMQQPVEKGSAQLVEPEAVHVEVSLPSNQSFCQSGSFSLTAIAEHSAVQEGRQHTEQWLATVGDKVGPPPLLNPVPCEVLSSSGARLNTPRMPASLGDAAVCRVTVPSLNGGADCSSSSLVQMSVHHVGTYAFKGCGAMDIVCLTSDAMLAEAQAHSRSPPKGAKGTLIMASSGPVMGLQGCPVMLPNVLAEFKQAWASMITSTPEPRSGARSRPAASAYTKWAEESMNDTAAQGSSAATAAAAVEPALPVEIVMPATSTSA